MIGDAPSTLPLLGNIDNACKHHQQPVAPENKIHIDSQDSEVWPNPWGQSIQCPMALSCVEIKDEADTPLGLQWGEGTPRRAGGLSCKWIPSSDYDEPRTYLIN